MIDTAGVLYYLTGERQRMYLDHLPVPYGNQKWQDRLRDWRKGEMWKLTFPQRIAVGYAASVEIYDNNRKDFDGSILFEEMRYQRSVKVSMPFAGL